MRIFINLPLQFRISLGVAEAIMEVEREISLPELPENCISHILSFTSQRDVCRLSAVSKTFRAAADDNSIWNKFFPQECYQILTRAVSPLAFSSKRELYFRLCDSILIDGGTKRFWVEPSTGKTGYMLTARGLGIIWSNDPHYWRLVSRHDSRFNELWELLEVCWLYLWGEMDCTLLSANTKYKVIFVLKFGERSYGWNSRPIKFSVVTAGEEHMESEEVLMEIDGGRQRIYGGGWMEAVADDGWMEGWIEVVAGEFTVTANSSSVRFDMKEVESNQWKRGLLIDGVRIVPDPN